MLFLAVAIHLGQVTHRVSPVTPLRSADCLTLCDGRLLAILYNTAEADGRASVAAAVAMARTPQAEGQARTVPHAGCVRGGLDHVGRVVLPIPPPTVC